MAVVQYSMEKEGSKKLSTHFTVREFRCQDYTCDLVKIDGDLVSILQKMRGTLGVTLTITSGYRCTRHNASVGGASASLHVQGQAADIVSSKSTLDMARAAEAAGAKGVIRYTAQNFVHVDTRAVKYYAVNSGDATTVVSTFGNVTLAGGTGDKQVREIQRKMNSLYGTDIAVDGYYGPATKSALVKGLQTEIVRQKGKVIVIDGVWGTNTRTHCMTLSQRSTGGAVYVLQGILYCRSYTNAGFSGTYAAAVTGEVKRFQGENGLRADGIAGPDTFDKLFA